MKKTFDRFSVRVIENMDGEWIAYLIGMPKVSATGATIEDAIHALKNSWESTKAAYLKRGEEIPHPKSGDN